MLAEPGDMDRGVCKDFVVRAMRTGLGIEFQRLVHEDIRLAFVMSRIGRYSARSVSMGSSSAARLAGSTPADRPIRAESNSTAKS